MKRPVVEILVVGLVAAILSCVLHYFGLLRGLENAISGSLSGDFAHRLPDGWQYPLVFAVAFFVAWFTVGDGRSPSRPVILVLILVVELVALFFICAFYRALFQPVPSLVAAILSFAFALAMRALPQGGLRRRSARHPLEGRVSEADLEKIRSGELEFKKDPRFAEVTALVCDLANKYDLAESSPPEQVAKASQDFSSRAREILLRAGAYLHATDGEGVVALFGFVRPDEEHANKAVAAAFELTRALAPSSRNGDSERDAHVGVSSGQLVSAGTDGSDDLWILGEPIELARRFAVANRIYGSHILIGPRTFAMASERFIARPIDFLGGPSSQERHEVYEPLASVAEAPPDLVERRDSFWNGVVLYREKRWGEAYAQFQKARGPLEVDDEPLNIYLRRLEPLALHLVEGDL